MLIKPYNMTINNFLCPNQKIYVIMMIFMKRGQREFFF